MNLDHFEALFNDKTKRIHVITMASGESYTAEAWRKFSFDSQTKRLTCTFFSGQNFDRSDSFWDLDVSLIESVLYVESIGQKNE